jgi:hypothetical protein
VIAFDEKDGALIFAVRVIPRSSRSEIVGEHDGALKVKLNAPPVDGAANEELIRLLAKAFDLPKKSIAIVGGQTSKSKLIQITGLNKKALTDLLNR